MNTQTAPIIDAIIAIISGVAANRLAVAAGIINRAVISKTPTIFIEMAITAATRTINKKLENLTDVCQQFTDLSDFIHKLLCRISKTLMRVIISEKFNSKKIKLDLFQK